MFRQSGEDIDCGKSLLLAKMCTRLKKITSVRKGKPWLDLKKLYAERQEVQDAVDEKAL